MFSQFLIILSFIKYIIFKNIYFNKISFVDKPKEIWYDLKPPKYS